MCDCCANKCIVTLSTLANSSNVNLPDSSRVRESTVNSILVRRSGSGTLKDVNGRTLAADTVIATAHLKLVDKNGFAITDSIPLSVLQRDYNSPDAFRCKYQNVDPTQTVVKLDTGASGYDATHVVEIVFGLDCEACGF